MSRHIRKYVPFFFPVLPLLLVWFLVLPCLHACAGNENVALRDSITYQRGCLRAIARAAGADARLGIVCPEFAGSNQQLLDSPTAGLQFTPTTEMVDQNNDASKVIGAWRDAVKRPGVSDVGEWENWTVLTTPIAAVHQPVTIRPFGDNDVRLLMLQATRQVDAVDVELWDIIFVYDAAEDAENFTGGYALALRADPVGQDVTMHVLELRKEGGSHVVVSHAATHPVVQSSRLHWCFMPSCAGIRPIRICLDEGQVASAFTAYIRRDKSIRESTGIKGPGPDLDAAQAESLNKIISDLLLSRLGAITSAGQSAPFGVSDKAATLAGIDFRDVKTRLRSRMMISGTDWWGLIQFACYVSLVTVFLICVFTWLGRCRWCACLAPSHDGMAYPIQEFLQSQITAFGFIGTVIGISFAMAPASRTTADDKLIKDLAISEITMNMATALNTTFVALICMVPAVFLVILTTRLVNRRS